ncbi:MAG: hypothetical protein RBS82_12475 [Syntrophales bacterium]|nr:hypothetical protein [Syntrophales bacterium]
MREQSWEENPKWKNLQRIDQGDIVHLKLRDGFLYLVKVIVKSVTDAEVVGIVEAIFDYDSKMPLTGGHILELVNKELSFEKKYVQKIIKKAQ